MKAPFLQHLDGIEGPVRNVIDSFLGCDFKRYTAELEKIFAVLKSAEKPDFSDVMLELMALDDIEYVQEKTGELRETMKEAGIPHNMFFLYGSASYLVGSIEKEDHAKKLAGIVSGYTKKFLEDKTYEYGFERSVDEFGFLEEFVSEVESAGLGNIPFKETFLKGRYGEFTENCFWNNIFNFAAGRIGLPDEDCDNKYRDALSDLYYAMKDAKTKKDEAKALLEFSKSFSQNLNEEQLKRLKGFQLTYNLLLGYEPGEEGSQF